MTGRILVADDDAIIRKFILLGLREQGFVVNEATTIASALEAARSTTFDAWIFDRHMPGGDFFAAMRVLRAEGRSTPALFLTASSRVEQRAEGLDAGADDYLSKPFSMVELTARVRALLRRPAAQRETVLLCGPIELHLDTSEVRCHGQKVAVTAHEWRLLALLARRPGVVFARKHIIAEVGATEGADDVAVDHLVSRLRRKLRATGADKLLKTVRGLGFSWDATARESGPEDRSQDLKRTAEQD